MIPHGSLVYRARNGHGHELAWLAVYSCASESFRLPSVHPAGEPARRMGPDGPASSSEPIIAMSKTGGTAAVASLISAHTDGGPACAWAGLKAEPGALTPGQRRRSAAPP